MMPIRLLSKKPVRLVFKSKDLNSEREIRAAVKKVANALNVREKDLLLRRIRPVSSTLDYKIYELGREKYGNAGGGSGSKFFYRDVLNIEPPIRGAGDGLQDNPKELKKILLRIKKIVDKQRGPHSLVKSTDLDTFDPRLRAVFWRHLGGGMSEIHDWYRQRDPQYPDSSKTGSRSLGNWENLEREILERVASLTPARKRFYRSLTKQQAHAAFVYHGGNGKVYEKIRANSEIPLQKIALFSKIIGSAFGPHLEMVSPGRDSAGRNQIIFLSRSVARGRELDLIMNRIRRIQQTFFHKSFLVDADVHYEAGNMGLEPHLRCVISVDPTVEAKNALAKTTSSELRAALNKVGLKTELDSHEVRRGPNV